ncbi:MAG: hypothetical protein IJ493_04105 [Clostridia bacterium]|nr:hypothetical protein [Clostridia bacterium]
MNTLPKSIPLTEHGQWITVCNPLPFDRDDIVYLDGIPMGQPFTDIRGRERFAADLGLLPGYGAKSVEIHDLPADLSLKFDYDAENGRLHTRYADIAFDGSGAIASLFDNIRHRQLCRPDGTALNRFTLSWGEVKFLGSRLTTYGAYQLHVRFEYAVGQSSHITQELIVSAKSPRIDFHTLIDWQDKPAQLEIGFDFADSSHAALFADIPSVTADGAGLHLPLTAAGQYELTYALLPHGAEYTEESLKEAALLLRRPPIVYHGRLDIG